MKKFVEILTTILEVVLTLFCAIVDAIYEMAHDYIDAHKGEVISFVVCAIGLIILAGIAMYSLEMALQSFQELIHF